jgi:cobalt/nickel transport system permease protein
VNVFDPNPRPSMIRRRDPRVRVVIAMAFAVTVCLSKQWQVLGAALAVSLLLTLLARASYGAMARRLIELNLFMLMLAVFLPLTTPGEAALKLGPLVWSIEGLWCAGHIALRANAILIAVMALLGSMEPAHLGFALDRLGAPEKFCHLLLFMVRYIEVIHQEYHRLRDAMRVRGFRPRCDRHTLRTFGYLIGQLLTRSLDRSERILNAMKCRGFRGRLYTLDPFHLGPADAAFSLVAAVVVLTLACLEWT